jgi:AcrR family transcriptional regulator
VDPALPMTPRPPDRRVRRSRAALMAAAVRLVSERGTTAIAATELAEAADVSRKVLYLHFDDRDGLLVAAAVDLVDRELTARAGQADTSPRSRILALAQHFARHRPFYRAMLTGSCAFATTRALSEFFSSLAILTLRELFADLDEATERDLALFHTGGTIALTNDWLVNGVDPLEPADLAARLLRLAQVLQPGALGAATGEPL